MDEVVESTGLRLLIVKGRSSRQGGMDGEMWSE